MGYYSQVGYVIQGKKEEIIPILLTYRMTYEPADKGREALDECNYALDDGCVTIKFHEDSAKWYAGYDSADSHTALFDAFREAAETEGSTINGCFVRIGEDDSDIETDRYGAEPYDLVRPARAIEFDVDAGGNLEDILK